REPVAIFSLEMSKESLLLRMLASEARVDAHKFRTGHMNRDDWGKITGARSRAFADDRRLSSARCANAHGPRDQPPGGSLEHLSIAQGARQGIEAADRGSQPAHARS